MTSPRILRIHKYQNILFDYLLSIHAFASLVLCTMRPILLIRLKFYVWMDDLRGNLCKTARNMCARNMVVRNGGSYFSCSNWVIFSSISNRFTHLLFEQMLPSQGLGVGILGACCAIHIKKPTITKRIMPFLMKRDLVIALIVPLAFLLSMR